MPQTNRFKHALAAGQAQIGLWSAFPSPYVTELIGGSGYDWIMLDTEHSPNDVPQVMAQLQALDAAQQQRPTSAVVRPAWNDSVLIKRYLDIGAQTLLVPFVQNAQEAQAAMDAMRYAPAGIRGMGGSTRASNFGRDSSYIAQAQQELCLLVQVETQEALAEIEAIAAIEGVDGIFIGPADLSASLGHLGNPGHADVQAAIEDAIRRIVKSGKAAGSLAIDETLARRFMDWGASFMAVGIDMTLLARGTTALAERFADAKQ